MLSPKSLKKKLSSAFNKAVVGSMGAALVAASAFGAYRCGGPDDAAPTEAPRPTAASSPFLAPKHRLVVAGIAADGKFPPPPYSHLNN